LQKYNIKEIEKAGGIGIILYPKDFDRFKKMILEIKKEGE
ncbi:TPA: VRR-NUC domain-containing protein, partial [Clostridioides difficile]|nr:VRR-NUC domain-containing protein [Clostridioides difficile]